MPVRFFGKTVRVNPIGCLEGVRGGNAGREDGICARGMLLVIAVFSMIAIAATSSLAETPETAPVEPGIRPGEPVMSGAGQGGTNPAKTSIYRAARESDAPSVPPDTSRAPLVAPQVEQGERLVAASLAALAQHQAIVADLRQSAIVSGRRFVGTGRYIQAGLGDEQRFRFESSLSGESETFHFLEVSDGVAFWSFEKHGDLAPSINRVDLRSVRRKLEGFGPFSGDTVTLTPHLGGIQQILSRLREWFRFDRVESAMLGGEPAWTVEGRWNPEGLARVVPDRLRERVVDGSLEPSDLPEGMPWTVRVILGKRDLFPNRIEWFAVPGPRPATDDRLQVVGLLEFHEVHIGGSVDASAFVYRPAADGLSDATAAFLEGVHPLRP